MSTEPATSENLRRYITDSDRTYRPGESPEGGSVENPPSVPSRYEFIKVLGSGQFEFLPQHLEQAFGTGDVDDSIFFVDFEADDHRAKHLSRRRRARTPAACRRYDSVERWSVIGLTSADTVLANSSRTASEGSGFSAINASA